MYYFFPSLFTYFLCPKTLLRTFWVLKLCNVLFGSQNLVTYFFCLPKPLLRTFWVPLGVEGSLSEQDGLFLRGNTELVVEGVVPDLLHVVPVGDDTVLNGVLQGEDTWKNI